MANIALVLLFVLLRMQKPSGAVNEPGTSCNSPDDHNTLRMESYLSLARVVRTARGPTNGRSHWLRARFMTAENMAVPRANEPLTYVAIDPKDFVPLIIEGAPEMKSDGQGKSVLTVSLSRKNAERLEALPRAHLHGRIALVVDGEIVTLHKIRSVVTGGRLQITRCTDNACEVIRSKLVN